MPNLATTGDPERTAPMSLSRSPENTQIRINAALEMIDQADDPLKVRFTVADTIGYIEALCDEH